MQRKKLKEDRITLAVCSNANGSHRIPLYSLVSQRNLNVQLEQNDQFVNIIRYHQKNTWMDTPMFMQWYYEIFCRAVRSRTHRPVLLLLVNAPGHITEYT